MDNGKRVERARGKSILAWVLAGACLIWVFHDVHPGTVIKSVATLDPAWLAAAIALDILSYVCQGFRWRLLLERRISVIQATQAIYAGLFINEVFPMRLGEIARAYMVSRWLAMSFSLVVSSIIIERTFDAVWLTIGIGLTAMFVRLPANLLRAGDVLGIAVLIAAAVLLYAAFHGRREGGDQGVPGTAGFIETFVLRLRMMGRSRLFYTAFAFSAVYLMAQILSFWLVMRAYGLALNVWAGAATLLIIHLGTAIPNTPANIGTYQFFCVLGLTLFGIDKSTAAGFSVVVFVALTIPLWIAGFLSLSRSGITTRDIRQYVGHIAASGRKLG
jgi:uncharacterized membrane protein YbhN (UPF0104 family)